MTDIAKKTEFDPASLPQTLRDKIHVEVNYSCAADHSFGVPCKAGNPRTSKTRKTPSSCGH